MKQITWIVLTWLVLGCPAHAASFDCARAETKVEKLICADAELSKLDEDLAAAYTAAREVRGNEASLRTTQRQWQKERNSCTDAQCVKNSYSTRLSSLANEVNSKQASVETLPTASRKKGNSNQEICTVVSDTLMRISKLPPQSYEDPFYVDSIEIGGRSYSYQSVDLDGDGKADKVEQSCGSPSDGTCTLYVALSSGGGYEVDEEIFHVMHVESKYYLLVGHPSSMKNHRRRMYALSAKGAELVCKSF